MSWLAHRWLIVYGVSFLVVKDCKGLFLRHTESGKCIAVGEMFLENNIARRYWAEMVNNCLNVSASFRYLDTELLQNIDTRGTLASLYDNPDRYKNRWFVYKGKNDIGLNFEKEDNHRLKQTVAGSLYFYDKAVNSCGQPNGTYLDLKRDGCSNTAEQKFTFGSVTQYNIKMKDVRCSPKQHMIIKRADYGDFNNNGVFDDAASVDKQCSAVTSCQVKSLCGGKKSCELTMDNNLLPSDYCSDISKEIYTEYTCVDKYSSSTITTAPKIRLLSHRQIGPNIGFIQIQHDASWRNVTEENWDKNRQKMLCQHLGFDETDANDISNHRSNEERDIATGDLICYNTQGIGTSCCVHLQMSAIEYNVDLPYVKCKICDNPLLQAVTTFPDSVFSGSGSSNYKNARITENGWCASRRKYLFLDLQKEYHITRVVVMGDRDQTKRSESYSLKYSNDKSLVDGSSAVQITGNQNGYQASTTLVDIYNVRYIKIQSTASTDFCLRIELCGEAPSGPPLHVRFTYWGKNRLDVSWNAPDTNFWNGILTRYLLCYNQPARTPRCKFIRSGTRLQGTIYNLQPTTKYFVTVSAGTKVGYGNKSLEISKITSGEAVHPITMSSSSLNIDIPKPANYIKEVMVIVQSASKNPTLSKYIRTTDLKPYQTNTHDPYATAYLKVNDLPLTFVIGDGKEYHSEKVTYLNQPLKQNSSYIVFLRFFESQDSYYSTEWSNDVKTLAKPPAPVILKIISTGLKTYTISWFQPPLPDQQTVVMRYHAIYRVSNGPSETLNVSKEMTSIVIDVEFDKQYTFEIQVVTEAERSDVTSESWFSHSAPLEPAKKTDDGYTVKLRKPQGVRKIKTVALVLLLSKSSNFPAPEELNVQKSPPADDKTDNVAFIASEFNITEFQSDTVEISLRESRSSGRRKKRAVEVYTLAPNATYRTAQLDTDESGNRIWSYWSESFTFLKAGDNGGDDNKGGGTDNVDNGDPDKRNDGGNGEGSPFAAVGASVGVAVIIVASILAVIFFRRRTNKRSKDKEIVLNENYYEMRGIDSGDGEDNVVPDDDLPNGNNDMIYSNGIGDIDEKAHPPVPMEEFEHYVSELKVDSNYEFQREYDDLPKNTRTSWEVAKRPFNKKKNRYGNIATYDHCRVVLSGDENKDYINASYIDGIKSNSYIATQGPTKLTVNDMWRMVWEQHSYSIVMVTSLVELNRPKCEKYWPDKGSKKYGDIEVTLMKTEEFAYHVTHTLQLKKDGEEREVRHYYFHSWPDHGVPKYPTQLLAFRRHYRTHHMEQSGPIVVHCSAGVGRTGVFLAIDTILDKFEKGVINSIDVFGQVCAMRERRMHMVQTLEQYIFVHEAILETILCGMNEVDSIKLEKEIEILAEINACGMTGFQKKFKRLGEVSTNLSPDECIAGSLDENYHKNRNKDVLPAENNRVPLQYVYGVENSDYINAVFVNGYLGRNYFIATQSPLPNTINDFWRLVHSQKSSTIVLLNNVKDRTSFPKFWPTTRGQPTQYDRLTVQLDSETESNGIRTRQFILSSYPDLTDGQVVNIFHYTKWPDHRVPANGSDVIALTSLVENSRMNHGQGPIIVVCSDGAGRTGTYIAISNLLERMKIEQAMDVFQAIKIIRETRPQFVENAEQYRFCYAAMMAYMDGFSDYANFD